MLARIWKLLEGRRERKFIARRDSILESIKAGKARVHDYRMTYWGHAIHDGGHLEIRERAQWVMHGVGIRAGDCLDRRGTQFTLLRYYVHEVEYYLDPADMLTATVEFLGPVTKQGDFAVDPEAAAWSGEPEFSYSPTQYSKTSQIVPLRAAGFTDDEIRQRIS